MARHMPSTALLPRAQLRSAPGPRWFALYGLRSSNSCGEAQPRGSGNDFHADLFVGTGFARVLHRKHRIERCDRDRELREVGLAGGEALKLDAGPHQDAGPALGAVLTEELDHLEGEPGDDRDAQ